MKYLMVLVLLTFSIGQVKAQSFDDKSNNFDDKARAALALTQIDLGIKITFPDGTVDNARVDVTVNGKIAASRDLKIKSSVSKPRVTYNGPPITYNGPPITYNGIMGNCSNGNCGPQMMGGPMMGGRFVVRRVQGRR